MFRRQPRRRDEVWQQAVGATAEMWRRKPDHRFPRTSQLRPSTVKTGMIWTSQRPRRADSLRRSSKRSFLDSLIGLRGLKDTLLPNGAWQHVTRIEDLCHVQVSHNSLYHLDACAGSVLTPHDHITSVQEGLGNRVWVGGGQCRCCGSFLDPQLEHAETCSNSEATRRHYACFHAVVCGMKLADPGITPVPRELTASKSRPTDIFTTAVVPGRSAALDVCVASSIAAAARGDAAKAAFDRKFSHYRSALTTTRLCGRRTAGRTQSSHERFSTRQVSLPVETGSICRRNPFIAGGNTKSQSLSCAGGQPRHAQFSKNL